MGFAAITLKPDRPPVESRRDKWADFLLGHAGNSVCPAVQNSRYLEQAKRIKNAPVLRDHSAGSPAPAAGVRFLAELIHSAFGPAPEKLGPAQLGIKPGKAGSGSCCASIGQSAADCGGQPQNGVSAGGLLCQLP
jgi:hypothetical protein